MTGENDGIMVPVHISQKKDVTNPEKHSKKSVLYINKKGQFHMLPEHLALGNEKNHRGHIIEKTHKDYMKGFKMACGFDEKIGTQKFVQIAGKVSSIEDMSRFDVTNLVQKETLESEKAKKDAGVK